MTRRTPQGLSAWWTATQARWGRLWPALGLGGWDPPPDLPAPTLGMDGTPHPGWDDPDPAEVFGPWPWEPNDPELDDHGGWDDAFNDPDLF